ncbi:hypothetical protein [Pararhizobium sp.]|uniref:hypothetical protein n=1 Tax=Pararhizobium sp. TaxID=1977563 RepID=UPI00271D4A46|nr:hypothetical protein [Pararhizobium sp.]MDO9417964.1 hypothetical protein [Pararhizobium sp.]
MSGADVVPFRPRRSYLDECRARGVYQQIEELKAEQSELLSKIAKVKREASAEIVALAGSGGAPAAYARTVARDREHTIRRFKVFCAGFREAGLAGPNFAFLEHLLFETDIPEQHASELFASVCRDIGIQTKRTNHDPA